MTLMNYSFILGKTILRSSEFEDIETWNQQKKDSRMFLFFYLKLVTNQTLQKRKQTNMLICYKEKSNSRK